MIASLVCFIIAIIILTCAWFMVMEDVQAELRVRDDDSADIDDDDDAFACECDR